MATETILISLSVMSRPGTTFANIPVEVPCPVYASTVDLSQATLRELLDELERRYGLMAGDAYQPCPDDEPDVQEPDIPDFWVHAGAVVREEP